MKRCGITVLLVATCGLLITTAPASAAPPQTKAQRLKQKLNKVLNKDSALRQKAKGAMQNVLRSNGIQGTPSSQHRTNSANHATGGGTDWSYRRWQQFGQPVDPWSPQSAQIGNNVAQQFVQNMSGKARAINEYWAPPLRPGYHFNTSYRNDQPWRVRPDGTLVPNTWVSKDGRGWGPHVHTDSTARMNLDQFRQLQQQVLQAETKTQQDFIKQQARQFAWANKPGNATGWKCNYSGTVHANPDDCADPHKGGSWVTQPGAPQPQPNLRLPQPNDGQFRWPRQAPPSPQPLRPRPTRG